MKPGDLIQSRSNPNQIYIILNEEVDPDDGLMNYNLLDLRGIQRTWAKFSINKVYKVINEKETP